MLTRQSLDRRTRSRKQFDSIASGIATDLGGEDRLSTIQKCLIEGFCGAAMVAADLNAKLLLGEKIDAIAHAQVISIMVRIAARLPLGRVPKELPIDPLTYAREFGGTP